MTKTWKIVRIVKEVFTVEADSAEEAMSVMESPVDVLILDEICQEVVE